MNPFDALKALRARRQQAEVQQIAEARLTRAQTAARGLHDDSLIDRVLELPNEVAEAQAEGNAQVISDLQMEALGLFAEVQRRGLLASLPATVPVAPPPVHTMAAKPALTREQFLERQIAEIQAERAAFTPAAQNCAPKPVAPTHAEIREAAYADCVAWLCQKPGGRQ